MVFDTNVFAYALLNVPEHREQAARALERSQNVLVPDSFRVEIANVVWQWIRSNDMPIKVGQAVVCKAEALVTQFVSSKLLWELALTLSVECDHPVYDTMFIAIATLERTRVVTYDRRLLKRFPEYTQTVSGFLKNR